MSTTTKPITITLTPGTLVRTAIQCWHPVTGETGSFFFSGNTHRDPGAIHSPVFPSLCNLFLWARGNGFEPVPGTAEYRYSGHARYPGQKAFLVASVSANANSFGLNGVILVARDGEAFEAGTYATGNFTIEKGEFVTLPIANPGATGLARYRFVSTGGRTFEIPRALPKCPENVLAELFLPTVCATARIPFSKLSAADRFQFERRDCAVRALAIASGLAYAAAHSRCRVGGRRSKFGFNDRKFVAVLKASGFVECPLLRDCTLADAMPALAHGRFVISVNDHYFAVVHGTVTDMLACAEGPRRRIKWVYRLTDTATMTE